MSKNQYKTRGYLKYKENIRKNSKTWYFSHLERAKELRLKNQHNLSLEEYNRMLIDQHYVCAICNQKETETKHGTIQSLSVDHCHKTNKIRGLLCNDCNIALGKFKDSVYSLQKAILYLSKDIM